MLDLYISIHALDLADWTAPTGQHELQIKRARNLSALNKVGIDVVCNVGHEVWTVSVFLCVFCFCGGLIPR